MEKDGEKGTVIQNTDGIARIRMEPATKDGCEGCGLCAVATSGARTLEVSKPGLQQGEKVLVRTKSHPGYVSILLLLVLPMVLSVTGLATASAFWPQSGILSLLSALLGLAIGFGVAWLFERHIQTGPSVHVERLKPGPDPPTRKPADASSKPKIARCCDAGYGFTNDG